MRVRIKMCGITTAADAQAAVQAGADAIGLVFYPPSKRAVTTDQGAEIARAVGAYVSVVGLFVDPQISQVHEVLAQVALDELQFHGQESAAFCAQFQRRYSKAIPMRSLNSPAAVTAYVAGFPDASGFLLDAFGGVQSGGSGECFDWSLIPNDVSRITIAGGLSADNVGQLLAHCRPYAVDVSSGIESAPGVKSAAKMHAFAQAVAAHR